MRIALSLSVIIMTILTGAASAACPYDINCLNNPYGGGNPYKADGLINRYSRYGSPYSNDSWTNPYATNAPKIYDQNGEYHGRLSANPYDPDSVANPYGRYGNPYLQIASIIAMAPATRIAATPIMLSRNNS